MEDSRKLEKPPLNTTSEEAPKEISKAKLAHQSLLDRRKARIAELRLLRASRPRTRRRGCGSCG